MVKIQQKIMTQQYSNLEEMGADCVQMFENAYKYNDPESLIYKVCPPPYSPSNPMQSCTISVNIASLCLFPGRAHPHESLSRPEVEVVAGQRREFRSGCARSGAGNHDEPVHNDREPRRRRGSMLCWFLPRTSHVRWRDAQCWRRPKDKVRVHFSPISNTLTLYRPIFVVYFFCRKAAPSFARVKTNLDKVWICLKCNS